MENVNKLKVLLDAVNAEKHEIERYLESELIPVYMKFIGDQLKNGVLAERLHFHGMPVIDAAKSTGHVSVEYDDISLFISSPSGKIGICKDALKPEAFYKVLEEDLRICEERDAAKQERQFRRQMDRLKAILPADKEEAAKVLEMLGKSLQN